MAARSKSPKSFLSVRVEGMSTMDKFPGGIDSAQVTFLNGAGKRLRNNLAAASPRKSGRLMRSWRYQVDPPNRAIITNDQPYAKAQDRGAFIRPKRSGGFLRFRIGGREVFAKAVRLKPTRYTAKGLRGRGRIVREEFDKAMSRVTV